ncbi:hypothetical protein OQA88_1300 [Cercophora sp. LCS_1]
MELSDCGHGAPRYGANHDHELGGLHGQKAGMYARCRSALQRTPVSRRLLRRLPILVGLVLGILIWTGTSLRHGSPLLPIIFGLDGHDRDSIPSEALIERPHLPGTERLTWEPGMCNVSEIEFLRRPQLGLTSNIIYSRRCIKTARGNPSPRDTITNITTPLITTSTPVNLTSCSSISLPPCEPITLHVPSPYPGQQYRHLLFGVATTYDRLNDSLPEFSHWLSGTGARLLAIVADATPTTNLSALTRLYQSHSINATFIPPTIQERINRPSETGTGPIPIEHHHFLLVRALHGLVEPGTTHWLSIIDDDTFFPSLSPLSAVLATYNHTLPLWLGALSDDFNSVRSWGYMAFGGAGVFLSPPLAEAVATHSEQCIRETTTHTGDGLLRDCVYTHTRTQLTLVPGLYQHDFRGDPSGFFESGVSPLSLHHWKSWYKAPVSAIARVATRVCGDCMLQRWRFGNDTILANGYSVAVYNPKVLQGLDLERVEGTWSHATRDYDPMYGLLRDKVSREDKKSYVLRDSVVQVGLDGNEVFRQVYVYRADEAAYDQETPSGIDEVVELVWEL